ncbi:MAG: YjjG family noncanonical pyrimidine nucleotidase [Eubacteriales bacterium]
MYSYLLFDADGTLFDFKKSEASAFSRTFRLYGMSSPSDEVYARYHSINQSLWDALDRGEVTKDYLTIERFRRLFTEFDIGAPAESFNRDYLRLLGEGDFLLDGAHGFIHALRAARPDAYMAIITNGVAATQLSRFRRSSIRDCFDSIFISEEIGATKPDVRYFNGVLAGIPGYCEAYRRETVVIGDSPAADILGANNARLASVWYNPEHRENRTAAVPTYTASSYAEIERIINA